MEVKVDVEGGGDKKMARWCRQRAENLALKDQALLEACEVGQPLAAADGRRVEADLRIAMTAARDTPVVNGGQDSLLCVQCSQSSASYVGYSCRCKSLCQGCATSGDRVKECPLCGDITEFVLCM